MAGTISGGVPAGSGLPDGKRRGQKRFVSNASCANPRARPQAGIQGGAKQPGAVWPTERFDDSVSGGDSEALTCQANFPWWPVPSSVTVCNGWRFQRTARRPARDPAFACRLDQRRDRRSVRAEKPLRAKVFGVREDRDWRSTFMREGLPGIERHPAPGCSPVKAQAALAVARELFAATVENRINWTLARLAEEIERRTLHRISHSRLSVVLRKKGLCLQATTPHPERPAERRGHRAFERTLVASTGLWHRLRGASIQASPGSRTCKIMRASLPESSPPRQTWPQDLAPRFGPKTRRQAMKGRLRCPAAVTEISSPVFYTLSGPRLGQTGRRFARCGSRPLAKGRHDRRARLRFAAAHGRDFAN
jgi:transposase